MNQRELVKFRHARAFRVITFACRWNFQPQARLEGAASSQEEFMAIHHHAGLSRSREAKRKTKAKTQAVPNGAGQPSLRKPATSPASRNPRPARCDAVFWSWAGRLDS